VKGLAELTAENDALVARAEAKRKASLRRLKQRIANVTSDVVGDRDGFMRAVTRRDINAAIDEWDAAERRKGSR
jgi:hypothetical protein